jgi:hypothetical protein
MITFKKETLKTFGVSFLSAATRASAPHSDGVVAGPPPAA